MKRPIIFLGMLLFSMISEVDLKQSKQKQDQLQLLKSLQKQPNHPSLQHQALKSKSDLKDKDHKAKTPKKQKQSPKSQKSNQDQKPEKKNQNKNNQKPNKQISQDSKGLSVAKAHQKSQDLKKSSKDSDKEKEKEKNSDRKQKKQLKKDLKKKQPSKDKQDKKHKSKSKIASDSEDSDDVKIKGKKQQKTLKKESSKKQKSDRKDVEEQKDKKSDRKDVEERKDKKSDKKDEKKSAKINKSTKDLKKDSKSVEKRQDNKKSKKNQKGQKNSNDIKKLNPNDFKLLQQKLTIIDTRPTAQDGLIKGSYWFADEQIIQKWIGVVLKKDTDYLLVTEKGKQKETVEMFKKLGYKNIKGINGFDVKDFSGEKDVPAIKQKKDLELEKCFNLNLKSNKGCKGVTKKEKKVPNSMVIPLNELEERVDELKGKENIVIDCKDQSEAKVAYSMLAKKGIYCYVLSESTHENNIGTQELNGLGYTIVKY